jgi:hypothetical protein
MIELNLPSKLRKALEKEAADAQIGLSAHIIKKLESVTAPIEFLKPEPLHQQLPNLVDFLNRIPAVSVMSSKVTPDAFWWIKLEIDTTHQLAWNVVEHLGFVLNYISLNERLPTIFMPVAPPPYLNGGGPETNLAWVIETKYNYIPPDDIREELQGRLPAPVDDESAWRDTDDA